MIIFRAYFDTQLAKAWEENIQAVRTELRTKIKTALRKKIGTLSIKTGVSPVQIIEDAKNNAYAAAALAKDPKKQIWQQQQQIDFITNHGIDFDWFARNYHIIQKVWSDGGGSQTDARKAVKELINKATTPTIVIIDDVKDFDFGTNPNVAFIGSSDEFIEWSNG